MVLPPIFTPKMMIYYICSKTKKNMLGTSILGYIPPNICIVDHPKIMKPSHGRIHSPQTSTRTSMAMEPGAAVQCTQSPAP